MKRQSMLWMLGLLLSGVTTLTGCSSSDENPSDQDPAIYDESFYKIMGLTRKSGQNNKGIVVKLFERSGMKLQVVDITDQFESATFFDKKIPVNHVYVEQLPKALQEMIIIAEMTRVCRMEYEGEYYYDI